MTISPNGDLTLHTLGHFEKIQAKIDSLNQLNERHRQFARILLGNATATGMDQRNRISIPAVLREFAAIEEETAVLCVGNSARLMPRTKWRQLHTKPNSAASLSLLEELSIPIREDRLRARQANAELAADVLNQKYRLLSECHRSQNYRKFELLIGEIFDCHNVGIVEVTQYSKDGGIDLILYIESNAEIEILFVQIKAGNTVATVSDLRDLIGAISLRNGKSGLLVTAAGSTSDAEEQTRVSMGTRIKANITDAVRLSEWIEKRLSPRDG